MSDIGIPADAQPTDSFSTIADVPISPENNINNPNQTRSGVTRGTQTIMNINGSYMTLGLIPDGSGQFGVAFFNASGTIISKQTASTQYYYDATTNKNIIQIGLLPDGTYGWVVARSGYKVSDIFSG